MKEIIFGERTRELAGEVFGPWTQGIAAKGKLIFVAGQVALVNGVVIGKGDIGVQYKQCLENIKGILEDAGASMNDIVKLVNYVVPKVTRDSDEYKSIVEVRKQYIQKDYPVSTLVQVAGLMVEDLLIEVDAIAVSN